MGRVVGRGLEGLAVFAFSQLILGLALLIQLLPSLVQGLIALYRIALILSYRLFSQILNRLNPLTMPHGVHISWGLWRVASSVVLSLAIGLTLWLLLGWHLSLMLVAALIVHGLIVGLTWEEIEKPAGLHLGVNVE